VNRFDLTRLLEVIPGLERPLVWLEDGVGRGLARLAWGARARHRLDWSDEPGDRLATFRPPVERRVYGVLSYDLGLPPHAARRQAAVAQPLADLFEPANELVIDLASGTTVTGISPGGPARERSAGPPVRRSAGPPTCSNAASTRAASNRPFGWSRTTLPRETCIR
jgi:hypothetical protein